MKALEIRGLKKSFKSNHLIKSYKVLKNIDIGAEQGEIYGFLGPNGAGKTTTIKCVMGIIFRDRGEIRILGSSANEIDVRNKIGFLPENPYYYEYLTAGELLQFTGMLYSIPRKEIKVRSREWLRIVGLEKSADVKLKKFSKGMLQRIGLAQAMLHDPELLILDEPFSGLDPVGRKQLRDVILSLRDNGKTIFFSSHILQDMELIVDRVGIILDGSTIREGKLADLISQPEDFCEMVFQGIPENMLKSKKIPYQVRNQSFVARVGAGAGVDEMVKDIVSQGGRVVSISPIKLSLEEIFLSEIETS
jgi:ABC-2 type transport system ATP-binding protein